MLGAFGYNLVRKDALDRLVADAVKKNELLERVAASSNKNDGPSLATPKANFRLEPAVNRAPPICTALAPKFDPERTPTQLAAQIIAFQEKGIAVIGTSAEKAASWRETEVFDRDTRNRHAAWDWAGPNIEPYTANVVMGMPSAALVEDLRTLFSGGDFEAFFRGVLGCSATVANVRLVKSPPLGVEGDGAQEWHVDGSPAGIIRGVLYLTDVDPETGPFQYRDSEGMEHTVLGKTGDLLIFDAMRLVHRAMPPKNKTRTAIDLVFMPRLPDEELRVIVAGMNHWPADPFFYAPPLERSGSPDLH
jgi:hypothetical protein